MRDYVILENGIKAYLAKPYSPKVNNFYIERKDVMKQLISSLLNFGPSVETEKVFPIIFGPPGVGKTELILQAAIMYGNNASLWVFQGHADISPEQIVFGQRLLPPNSENQIGETFLSAISSAIVEGGWCLVDELGKIPNQSLSLLLTICESQRDYLDSILLNQRIEAKPGFRIMFTAQSNEMDNLPHEFTDRLKPIEIPYPTEDEINLAIKRKFNKIDDHLIENLINRFWILWHTKKRNEYPTYRKVLNLFSSAQCYNAMDTRLKSLDNVPFCGISESNLELAFKYFK